MEEKKPDPRLDASRFKLAEEVNVAYTITVEAGLTQEQITNAAFMSHVAQKLRAYDRVYVRSDDDSLFGELLVTEVGHGFAKVHVLRWEALSAITNEEEVGTGYRIDKRGPHKKWCVVRESDSVLVHEGSESRAAAKFWLDEHLKTIRKAA